MESFKNQKHVQVSDHNYFNVEPVNCKTNQLGPILQKLRPQFTINCKGAKIKKHNLL